jgi:hypothetical protein
MNQIIKIKCNGPNQHVNDIDLGKVLQPTTVVRSTLLGFRPGPPEIPERLVLRCRFCTEGRVVITREMTGGFQPAGRSD